jgi:hypothetical protein
MWNAQEQNPLSLVTNLPDAACAMRQYLRWPVPVGFVLLDGNES